MIPALDEERPLSLYIHIPYCFKKCDYCAFYSIEDKSSLEEYYNVLLKELTAVADEWKRPFKSIYIGGGNPGLLGYEKLLGLLDAAERHGMPEEVTVEFNPENINSSLSVLKGKATRISVGIQSLNSRTLKALGRNASLTSSVKALEILSSIGFDFNADIITAVPGETVEESLEDIRRIASYNPDHISFYCLSFEEDTPIVSRLRPLSGEDESVFLKEGWRLLNELGYEHYEVSAFAKPGKRSIHNQVYWDLGQYIGIGASAESSLGYRKIISARNQESAEDFIRKPEFDCFSLSKEEMEEEYIMLRLRVRDGIIKSDYSSRFGYAFDERFKSQIEDLDPAWYSDSADRFALTEDGVMFLDHIILILVMAI